MKIMLLYLILINALGYVLMLADKKKARRNLWRIPERTLMTVAVLGGSLGVLTAMHLLRHKTKRLKFTIGVPVCLATHILIVIIYTMTQK